jgi:hypothetical protein
LAQRNEKRKSAQQQKVERSSFLVCGVRKSG